MVHWVKHKATVSFQCLFSSYQKLYLHKTSLYTIVSDIALELFNTVTQSRFHRNVLLRK